MRAHLERHRIAPDELLTIREVAQRLRKRVASVEAMVERGDLESVRRWAVFIPGICISRFLPE